MIAPGRCSFEFLGFLCMGDAKPRGRERFRFNGARRAFQTPDMPTEVEETSVWRCRTKIHQAVRLVQEITP